MDTNAHLVTSKRRIYEGQVHNICSPSKKFRCRLDKTSSNSNPKEKVMETQLALPGLSQSMDSVNTATGEEEVHFSFFQIHINFP